MSDIMNKVKIVVMGDECAGKTSLVRCLIDDVMVGLVEGPRFRTSTRIRSWTLCEGFDFSVWDIGSREIHNGAYKLFLSPKSLYILVMKEGSRKEECCRWLDIIYSSVGEYTPVIVIGTDCVGEDILEKDYPGVLHVLRRARGGEYVWNKDALQILRAQIQIAAEYDDELAAARFPDLPKERRELRDVILQLAKDEDVIRFDTFEDLCNAHGIHDTIEILSVLRTLHNTGILCYYGFASYDEVVRSIIVLNPAWLSEAVTTIYSRALDRRGILSVRQLEYALTSFYPVQWHDFLCRVMTSFGLWQDVDLPDQNYFFVSNAMPRIEDAPYSAWPKTTPELHVRCLLPELSDYTFVKFSSSLYSRIRDSRSMWRDGFEFRTEGCFVRCRRYGDTIDIVVNGTPSRRRSVLAPVLQAVWDEVSSAVYVHVPLPDRPGETVGYEDLLAMERIYGLDHKFYVGEVVYVVRDLLMGPGAQPSPMPNTPNGKIQFHGVDEDRRLIEFEIEVEGRKASAFVSFEAWRDLSEVISGGTEK